MGETYYPVSMLVTTHQELAIKSLFKENNWQCLIQVLSDELVSDIVDSGFTNVFPKRPECLNEYTDKTIHTADEEDNISECRDVEARSESSDSIMMDSVSSDGEKIKMECDKQTDKISNSDKGNRRRSTRQTKCRRGEVLSPSSKEMPKAAANQTPKKTPRRQSTRRNSSVLNCIDCFKEFHSKEDLWDHRNKVKHPLPTTNIPTKYNLDVYSLMEHKQMGFIQCDACESFFLGKRRQMKHFYVSHRDLMPAPTCPICSKEFKTYGELLKHKREEDHRDSVSSLNNYQCDLCGKHMTSYSNFVQHKQLVCGIGEKEMAKIRIHACDICDKLFKSPRHVRRHKKISHFKVPEVCDVCGTVCQGRKALDVHKKRHDEKNKKHACSECGKTFFSDSKLQEHIRTHTKEKPFKCPLCSYTCAVKPNIHKHATNVHKETVVPIDLRKAPVSVAKKTATFTNTGNAVKQTGTKETVNFQGSSNSTQTFNEIESESLKKAPMSDNNFTVTDYTNSGVTTNEHGKSYLNLTNKHVPNTYIAYEMSNSVDMSTGTGLQTGSIQTTYMDHSLNVNNYTTAGVVQVNTAVPVSYGDMDIGRNIQGNPVSTSDGGSNPSLYNEAGMGRNIQELSQETQPTHSEPIYMRTEYTDYPYQYRASTLPIDKSSFKPETY